MSSLSSPVGIVAIVALCVAAVALALAGTLALALRRLRAAQATVLGDGGARDLVAHAAELEHSFGALSEQVHQVAQHAEVRLDDLDGRLRRALAHHALVRYDAYNEMSGHQSLSIALLDESRSGIVLSSIHHRDQARVYAKQVHEGHSELELSPEEADALRLALGEG